MLGFSPPEWAYITSQRVGVAVSQSAARTLDRKVRMDPDGTLSVTGITLERLRALVLSACALLNQGAPNVEADRIHRLSKADTMHGSEGIRRMSDMGVPYAMVLYERLLGRPFAAHRDSVSELIGDSLESAIEEALHQAGISYRKTKRAERIEGFDQVPDFIIPSEFNPHVIIEAKVTEDDGTARDKVARIQRLDALRRQGQKRGKAKYELIACIAGRGFGVRREDMRRLLLATDGKVFTFKTLDMMVECTSLGLYRSK